MVFLMWLSERYHIFLCQCLQHVVSNILNTVETLWAVHSFKRILHCLFLIYFLYLIKTISVLLLTIITIYIQNRLNSFFIFKIQPEMYESKVSTVKSEWDQFSVMRNSNVKSPAFIPVPCPTHSVLLILIQDYSITNICKSPGCIEPLCPECITAHV